MRRLIALMAAGVLTFAACSGGSGGSNAAKTKEGKAVEDAVKSAGGDFCKLAANLDNLDSSDAPTADEMAEFRDALDEILAAFPADLEAQLDMDLFRRQIDFFIAYIDAAGGDVFADPTKLDEAATKRLEEVQEEYADIEERRDDIAENERKLDAYLETECGLDQDDDGDTDGNIEA